MSSRQDKPKAISITGDDYEYNQKGTGQEVGEDQGVKEECKKVATGMYQCFRNVAT